MVKIAVCGAVGKRTDGGRSGDAIDVAFTDEGCVIALADGAGAAKYGPDAALLAVRLWMEGGTRLSPHLKALEQDSSNQSIIRTALETLVRDLHHNYLKETSGQAGDLDYLATCLGVIVTEHTLYAIQIGDGFMVARWNSTSNSDQGLSPSNASVLFCPLQHFINEPTFVNDADIVGRTQYGIFPRPQFLSLSSDGLASVALERVPAPLRGENLQLRPYQKFFEPLEQGVKGYFDTHHAAVPDKTFWIALPDEGIQAFLDSPAVLARIQDDRSLLVAYFEDETQDA